MNITVFMLVFMFYIYKAKFVQSQNGFCKTLDTISTKSDILEYLNVYLVYMITF